MISIVFKMLTEWSVNIFYFYFNFIIVNLWENCWKYNENKIIKKKTEKLKIKNRKKSLKHCLKKEKAL